MVCSCPACRPRELALASGFKTRTSQGNERVHRGKWTIIGNKFEPKAKAASDLAETREPVQPVVRSASK